MRTAVIILAGAVILVLVRSSLGLEELQWFTHESVMVILYALWGGIITMGMARDGFIRISF